MEGGSILTRIATGDLQAVEECISTYERLIWALALRLSPGRAEAEDAVQEIFIDLWKSAASYDPARSSEAAFITMIARRRLIDRLRAGNRQPRMEEFTGAEAGLATAQQSAEAKQILRFMNELEEDRKKALMLAVCHGLTHAEVSQRLGIPLGTVKTHVRRGLEQIRKRLGEVFTPNRMGAAR